MLHFVSAQRFEAEFSVDIFSESHNDYIFVDRITMELLKNGARVTLSDINGM